MKNFTSFHPLTLFIYFICTTVIAMFITDAGIQLIFLLGAVSLCLCLEGRRFIRRIPIYILLFIVIALVNPLFNQNGATPLLFINGRAFTLEASIYGAVSSAMIVSVLLWFMSFSYIMTGDRLMYLFGRWLPKLSVVISGVFRYIPLFRLQAIKVNDAQKGMGIYTDNKPFHKTVGTLRVFSVLITWSLENAIDTADAMKARGYGQEGRTTFNLFKFKAADMTMIIFILLLSALVLILSAFGAVRGEFYPLFVPPKRETALYLVYAAYALLTFIPALIEVKEKIKWKYYKSGI